MKFIVCIAGSALLLTACATTDTAGAGAAEDTAQTQEQDEQTTRRCRRVRSTGSRAGTRVCD